MADWDDQERAALLALLRQGDSYAHVVESVIEAGGSARAALGVDDGLFPVPHADLELAQRDIAGWRTEGLGFLTFMDDDFPAQLREIHEMPPVLFWRGSLRTSDRAVSVVGTRHPTAEGLEFARAVTQGLVEAGVSVVAGLAFVEEIVDVFTSTREAIGVSLRVHDGDAVDKGTVLLEMSGNARAIVRIERTMLITLPPTAQPSGLPP